MHSVTDRVYDKLRYGECVSLGEIERKVLLATPDAFATNLFLPTKAIARRAGLTVEQTCSALQRLRTKGYVDCVGTRPKLWTSHPFFGRPWARELFPDHRTALEELLQALNRR